MFSDLEIENYILQKLQNMFGIEDQICIYAHNLAIAKPDIDKELPRVVAMLASKKYQVFRFTRDAFTLTK